MVNSDRETHRILRIVGRGLYPKQGGEMELS